MCEELKENNCKLVFVCRYEKTCVYKSEETGRCKFNKKGLCCSAVANVNRMVLELNKKMGFDLKGRIK